MAKKDKKKKKQNAKSRSSKKSWILLGIAMLALIPVLGSAVLIIVLGLLPAFVANYVDMSEDRNLAKAVLACNIAGVLPIISGLWRRGIDFDTMWQTLQDPNAWLVMYSSAAFGWLLIWFFPQAVYLILKMVQDNNIRVLKRRQQVIISEWGMQVDTSSRKVLRNTMGKDKKKDDENKE